MSSAILMKPCVLGSIKLAEGKLILSLGSRDLEITDTIEPDIQATAALLRSCDGSTNLDDLARSVGLPTHTVESLLSHLHSQGFVVDRHREAARCGLEVVLELEDLQNRLAVETIHRNVFWRTCLEAQSLSDVPERVLIGMAIENYHFLCLEAVFDTPPLSYLPSASIRHTMNEFFREEHGHELLVAEALKAIGIDQPQLDKALPLPSTMALANGLAWWARTDPLFFFSTIGILEGQGIGKDSFVETCERVGMPEGFCAPLRKHAEVNFQHGHGNLSRQIFKDIPALDDLIARRLRRTTHLFMDLFDGFFSGIWSFYSTASNPIRHYDGLERA